MLRVERSGGDFSFLFIFYAFVYYLHFRVPFPIPHPAISDSHLKLAITPYSRDPLLCHSIYINSRPTFGSTKMAGHESHSASIKDGRASKIRKLGQYPTGNDQDGPAGVPDLS